MKILSKYGMSLILHTNASLLSKEKVDFLRNIGNVDTINKSGLRLMLMVIASFAAMIIIANTHMEIFYAKIWILLFKANHTEKLLKQYLA